MTLFISDPKLIQHCRISQLPQSAIDFFGSEVCFFCGVDEMRLCAPPPPFVSRAFLRLRSELLSKAGTAGEEIGYHLARLLSGCEHGIPGVPGEQRRNYDDGTSQKPRDEKNEPCYTA